MGKGHGFWMYLRWYKQAAKSYDMSPVEYIRYRMDNNLRVIVRGHLSQPRTFAGELFDRATRSIEVARLGDMQALMQRATIRFNSRLEFGAWDTSLTGCETVPRHERYARQLVVQKAPGIWSSLVESVKPKIVLKQVIQERCKYCGAAIGYKDKPGPDTRHCGKSPCKDIAWFTKGRRAFNRIARWKLPNEYQPLFDMYLYLAKEGFKDERISNRARRQDRRRTSECVVR